MGEDLDERQRRLGKIREQVARGERERCLTYMNKQQYVTYERKVKQEDGEQQSQNWIELVTDMQMRSEIIKAKIKDLAPDLFLKSVI